MILQRVLELGQLIEGLYDKSIVFIESNVEMSLDSSVKYTELVYGIGIDMTMLQHVLKILNHVRIL